MSRLEELIDALEEKAVDRINSLERRIEALELLVMTLQRPQYPSSPPPYPDWPPAQPMFPDIPHPWEPAYPGQPMPITCSTTADDKTYTVMNEDKKEC